MKPLLKEAVDFCLIQRLEHRFLTNTVKVMVFMKYWTIRSKQWYISQQPSLRCQWSAAQPSPAAMPAPTLLGSAVTHLRACMGDLTAPFKVHLQHFISQLILSTGSRIKREIPMRAFRIYCTACISTLLWETLIMKFQEDMTIYKELLSPEMVLHFRDGTHFPGNTWDIMKYNKVLVGQALKKDVTAVGTGLRGPCDMAVTMH